MFPKLNQADTMFESSSIAFLKHFSASWARCCALLMLPRIDQAAAFFGDSSIQSRTTFSADTKSPYYSSYIISMNTDIWYLYKVLTDPIEIEFYVRSYLNG